MEEKLIQQIRSLCEKPLNDMGISIYHLEFAKEGGENYLRFYIDKDDGIVDLDLCVEVSEVIGRILDRNDPIPASYTLEVSSSGVEKELMTQEHFAKALGKYVHFELNEAIDGSDVIEGILTAVNDDSYDVETRIKTRTKTVRIDKGAVAYARLAVKF